MHRRRFLQIAGRVGATLGVPALGGLGIQSLNASDALSNGDRHGGGKSLIVPLDTGWSIGLDPDNVGRDQQWFKSHNSDTKQIEVPSIIQQAFPGYHGVAWYWKEFQPEAHPFVGGRYLLRFHAVDYLADVWLNDVHVGNHEGGETPFVLDVTENLRPGQINRLAVRVLNPDDTRIDGILLAETPHRNKVVKFTNGNLYDFGGIIQPVELLLTPALHVTDLFVNPNWKTGELRLQTTLENRSGRTQPVRLNFVVTEAVTGAVVLTDTLTRQVPENATTINHELTVANYKLWDLDTPFLYQANVSVETASVDGRHSFARRFGFRDFRVNKGYFNLNGKRIFLKCTHTGNHTPFGQAIPTASHPDLLRRDLLYAKASGFNTVRWISGMALPYQLDMCDEIGLLAYEESDASWLLKDSPRTKEVFESAVKGMILRDRNHPSVAIWGVLNETGDGPVFREGQSCLPLIRSLDDSRLALLSSGRFDGHLEVGSASNPGTSQWEYVWGKEGPGQGQVAMLAPSGPGSGDFHLYPTVPQTPETNEFMRTLGKGGKPVFLSEYGIGSMMNVIHEARMYEQSGIRKDAEDFVLMRSMADRLSADWLRFGMETVYPYAETLLQVSQRKMARHRLLGFNLIRSNPMICGFNLTGMLDHALTGEGVWRFWRDWKPEAFDAMRDGWAPVRWCLFVEPNHTYAGRPVTLEGVLANEDVLRAGEYPVEFRVWGPNGPAWNKRGTVSIPSNTEGDAPLAIPVMKEEVRIQGPAGRYELVPYTPEGIAPPEASWEFYLSDASALPKLEQKAAGWGVPEEAKTWLGSHGVQVVPLESIGKDERAIILVGNLPDDQSTASRWTMLAERIAKGSTVIFLSPEVFKRQQDSSAWLPLSNKGSVYKFHDWLYHKECVAKPHLVFDGIQAHGILDWYYFGPVLPSHLFDGQDPPSEVMAAAFAAGYSVPGGYASGVLLGSYELGAGRFFINSFPLLENIDKHPVADRLLLNLISYAATGRERRETPAPADIHSLVERFGYGK